MRSLTNANQALGICVDHMRHRANMIKPKCLANVSLQLVLCANFTGWAETRPSFLAVCGPKFTKSGGGDPCRLTSFLLIVDIMFLCRDIFGQSSKSVPKAVFAPSPWTPGDLGPNFSNSSYKLMYVQVWLRSVQ